MRIRPVSDADIDSWLMMRCALKPELGLDAQREEVERILGNKLQHAALMLVDTAEQPVGFAEVSLRPQVDGFESSPVGYLGALFVKPDERRRGHGTGLVRAAEQWARQRGCRELASATPVDNDAAQGLHTTIGFVELHRVVQYKKAIPEPVPQTPVQPVQQVFAGSSSSVPATPSAPRPVPVPVPVTRGADSTPGSSWLMFHIAVGLFGLFCVWMTDLSSPDVLRGAVYPLLAFFAFLYVAGVFLVGRYNRRTDERNRGGELF